jgi:hydrogenase maturation protein HypF
MKSTVTRPEKFKIQNSKCKVILIGYGNTLRGDDGAGQRVAATVAEWDLPNVRSIAVHQLLPELSESLAATQLAIFVDVYLADTDQGIQVHCLHPNSHLSNHTRQVSNSRPAVGHTADPRSLLALTQAVYGTTPLSWWILIPVVQFEFGEQLSAIAEQGIHNALQQIQQLIGTISDQNITTEVAEEIRVRGTVQGVGFRPSIYRLAIASQLRGEVYNDAQGVLIRVAGQAQSLEQFVTQLQQESPPLAHITEVLRQPIKPYDIPFTQFNITPSLNTLGRTEITADAATCPQCLADVFNPSSRWYRYPFTNCTHCGPRFSIIRAIPYDRHHTSMSSFTLCSACQQDYDNMENRRFHAQPIACPTCGPKVWLEPSAMSSEQDVISSEQDVIAIASKLLLQGKIIAIKGLGGFHLACDATNETAVQTLRNRKQRIHKPFALMVKDPSAIAPYCTVNAETIQLLESAAAPIVLLPIRNHPTLRPKSAMIAPNVAPGLMTLGGMLPYTPLHHLLLQNIDRPLIMTSGNVSDQPQCIDNQAAREQLSSIANDFLLHDREIVNRLDDSVIRIVNHQTQILRRARGYVPSPIPLSPGFEQAPAILAMGSEMKNTFCLIQSGQAIISQHLGDLEQISTAYQQTLNLYLKLFDHQPEAIAIDLHPDYLSSKLGHELAISNHLHIVPIQHHHAHIAACIAEHQLPLHTPPVLGIALDGLGYGTDGTLWGGEFLLADYCTFQRLGSFQPIAMLGGTQAIRQPWRNTYAHLTTALGWHEVQSNYPDLELFAFLDQHAHPRLEQLLTKRINAPLASSCGRLFDAVAAALNLCPETCSYEGQAAIALESIATDFLANPQAQQTAELHAYPLAMEQDENGLTRLTFRPLWQALLTDLQQGLAKAEIAARFHLGLVQAIVHLTIKLHDQYSFNHVVLTGGVFQNLILQQQVSQRLVRLGFTVLTHHQVPANDGGLSLGQGAIAAARYLAGG